MLSLQVAVALGADAHLMGLGDNQTALLKFPTPEALARLQLTQSEFAQQYINVVTEEANKLDLTSKEKETRMSTLLYEYSKRYHLKGVHNESMVISGDGWFYDFGDSNRAFKRDCTVYTGY